MGAKEAHDRHLTVPPLHVASLPKGRGGQKLVTGRPSVWRGNMFECIVCGVALRGRGDVYLSEVGAVALCGARCGRRFFVDPPAFVPVAAEAELGGGG
jgi:hypothetical protein